MYKLVAKLSIQNRIASALIAIAPRKRNPSNSKQVLSTERDGNLQEDVSKVTAKKDDGVIVQLFTNEIIGVIIITIIPVITNQ